MIKILEMEHQKKDGYDNHIGDGTGATIIY